MRVLIFIAGFAMAAVIAFCAVGVVTALLAPHPLATAIVCVAVWGGTFGWVFS